MVLRMARPTTRDNSTVGFFKRRTPLDLIDRARGEYVRIDLPALKAERAVTSMVRVGQFVKLSLRSRDPEVIRHRHSSANAQLDRHFHALRHGASELSHRELVALSGEAYRLIVERSLDNPGTPDQWAAFKSFNRAVAEGRLMNAPPVLPDHVADETEQAEAA